MRPHDTYQALRAPEKAREVHGARMPDLRWVPAPQVNAVLGGPSVVD
jgi:hypothetical protein